MRPLHGPMGVMYVLLLEAISTAAGECGVLGDAASFRVGAGGSGCVICGDGNGAPCPAPSNASPPPPSSDDHDNAQGSSICYALAANPTIMALSGDEDVEVHRIPGCSCHASCLKCGYADMPTEETQCIECADPAATLFRTDDWDLYRTGSCGIPIAEGAARCQLTLDADSAALQVRLNFNSELKADMAAIMNIEARRIDIVTVAPGSIVVTFDVYPSNDESDSTPAEAIQLLQTTVAQGTSGEFAGFSAVSLQIVALPDEDEEGTTDLLDQEVVLSMVQVLIIGASVGGVLLLCVCILSIRAICCRKQKGADRYVAPVPNDLELGQAGSQNNSPATSPKSPAAIRRAREAAERAAAQDDELEASEEEEGDQLSPLDTPSYRDPYVEDWSGRGGGSPSGRREGRARSSSVSSSSGRSHGGGGGGGGGGGRSRSGSVSSGGSSRRRDDDLRRSRSGSISSGGSHRSRSGSISGSSSSRSRSRSISGASGHRSRSGSISSGGRERSHSDGRRRSVSSKQLVRTISEDEEIDPREDMLRAVQEHEAAMAAAAEAESPPGSVPHSPGSRHRSRSHSSSRRKSVSRPSRTQSRRDIEREDSYSGED